MKKDNLLLLVIVGLGVVASICSGCASPEQRRQEQAEDCRATIHHYGLQRVSMDAYEEALRDCLEHKHGWGRRK